MSLFDYDEDGGAAPPVPMPLAQSGMGGGPAPMSAQNMQQPAAPAGAMAPPQLDATGQPINASYMSPNPGANSNAPQGNLFDRVISRLKSGLTGDAPSAYGSMLSPQDIQNAKPSFIRALTSHDAHADFIANLDRAVSAGQQAVNIPVQQAVQQHYRAVQGAIANMFPPPTGKESPQAMAQRMGQMYSFGAQHNADPAWLKEVGDTYAKLTEATKNQPDEVRWVDDGKMMNPVSMRTGQPMPGLVPMPRGSTPDVLAHQAEMLSLARQNAENSLALRTQGQGDAEVKNFQASPIIKPLLDHASKYGTFLSNLAQVNKSNPASIGTFLYSAVQNLDTNAQMRQGILEKLEKFAPGVSQNAAMILDQKLAGKIPQNIIDNIATAVKSNHDQIVKRYTSLYNTNKKNSAGFAAGSNMLDPSMVFNYGEDESPAAPTGGKVRGYLTKPPK